MKVLRARISLSFKTLVFVGLTMIGLAVTLGSAIQRAWVDAQSREFEKQAIARVHAAALASEHGVFFDNRELLQGVVDGLGSESDVLYAYIYDREGEVLAATGPVPPVPDVEQLRQGRVPALRRLNPDAPISDLHVPAGIYWDVPVEEVPADAVALGVLPAVARELRGVVRVGFSAAELLDAQARNRATIWTLTAAATILALVMAFLLSSLIIINPIRRLAEATRQVAAGDLSIRVPVNTGDEIGDLAAAFNQMTLELRESHDELDRYGRTLEFQVEQRTEALHSANEELRHINDELALANRMKSEFLANMSHELRTPLNAIIGFSELLSDEIFGDLNDKQGRYVGNIQDSGRHLLNLINEILDLAKVESGKMEVQPEPFNPESAVSATANIVRTLAQAKNITLSMEAPAPIGVIIADPKKVRQILYNLLSNAIKFTPEDGEVRIELTLQPPGPTPQWLRVAVTDTGIGIDATDQERVFNEFEQVDGTHAREYAGTGLGLALTRKLVELHGGTISVESAVGHGSTFAFVIPLKRPDPAQADVLPPADEDGGTLLLYIGDGLSGTHDALDAFLEEHGFTVHRLTRNEDAVRVARETHPRAILLDLAGDPSGTYSAWHALHENAATATLPTVLFVSEDADDTGFGLCATAHFTKPIPRELLLEKLHILIPPMDSRPGRVLVVDDDEQFLELTGAVLKEAGYEVLAASGGEAGITAAETQAPDLILLDLMMPEVSGFDVVTRLRGNPATAGIPILIVTAKDLTEEDIRTLNGRVSSIAQKGLFSREDLLREIIQAHGQAVAGR